MQNPPPLEPPTIPPSLGPTRRALKRQKRNLLMRRLIAVGVFCGLTAAVGGGIGLVMRWVVPPTKLGLVPAEDQRVNVLVIGADPRALPGNPGDAVTRHVADFMHLLSFDLKTHQEFVLSIPRQTKVLLGHGQAGQIGDALAQGGAEHLKQVVEDAIGFPVHYYVYLQPETAKNLLTQLGGQKVYVAQPLQFTDEVTQTSLDLQPGWQNLTPDQTLTYAWHGDKGKAIERLERQQMLMERYQGKIHGMFSWTWFGGLADRAQTTLESNLPKQEFDYLADQLRQIDPADVTYAVLPGEATPDGGWLPSSRGLDGLAEKLKSPPGHAKVSVLHPTLEILYDDQADDKVMNLATKLTDQGFQVIRTSRAPVSLTETRLVDRAKVEQRSTEVVSAIAHGVGRVRVVLAPDEINPYSAQYTLQLGKSFFQ